MREIKFININLNFVFRLPSYIFGSVNEVSFHWRRVILTFTRFEKDDRRERETREREIEREREREREKIEKIELVSCPSRSWTPRFPDRGIQSRRGFEHGMVH